MNDRNQRESQMENENELRVTDRRRVYLNDEGGERVNEEIEQPNLKPSYVEELESRTKAAEKQVQEVQARFDQLRQQLQRETDETRLRLNRSADERAAGEKVGRPRAGHGRDAVAFDDDVDWPARRGAAAVDQGRADDSQGAPGVCSPYVVVLLDGRAGRAPLRRRRAEREGQRQHRRKEFQCCSHSLELPNSSRAGGGAGGRRAAP